MKVTTAIEILTVIAKVPNPAFLPAETNALQLGLEALIRFERYRRDIINSILDPLPGETEE